MKYDTVQNVKISDKLKKLLSEFRTEDVIIGDFIADAKRIEEKFKHLLEDIDLLRINLKKRKVNAEQINQFMENINALTREELSKIKQARTDRKKLCELSMELFYSLSKVNEQRDSVYDLCPVAPYELIHSSQFMTEQKYARYKLWRAEADKWTQELSDVTKKARKLKKAISAATRQDLHIYFDVMHVKDKIAAVFMNQMQEYFTGKMKLADPRVQKRLNSRSGFLKRRKVARKLSKIESKLKEDIKKCNANQMTEKLKRAKKALSKIEKRVAELREAILQEENM